MVKRTEFDVIDWDEADITKRVPPIWYPNNLIRKENYQGPKISWSDHFNNLEAQDAWIRKQRSDYWCSGKGVEYGHDKDSQPFVRLLYGPIRGKSMWYPLYKAAQNWNKKNMEAHQAYRRALTNAQLEDRDGPEGRMPKDDDGYLLFPQEDMVPYRD